jgi:bacillithiol biosynthesis cysteine-adding enzyme BshC
MTLETTGHTATAASTLVAPEKLGYSRLYLDFVAGRQPATDFFVTQSLDSATAVLDRAAHQRDRIVDILRRQNQEYEASALTMENVERMRDRRAVCVFAGQQAGLFGGPLFTIVKALAVAKAARLYAEKLGRPVVPMFWMAGDDHDFEEANHAYVLNRRAELCKEAYQTAPPVELPASEIRLDNLDELARVLGQLGECLGQTEFTPALIDSLRQAYTPNDTLVTAFAKFMATLTSELGVVYFNPGDPEAKRLAMSFFHAAVDRQDQVREAVLTANRRLEEDGYHLQVEKRENAVHLMCNLDGRKPILQNGDGFSVGEHSFDRRQLLELLDKHPEKFSPDVLTRPVFQSWLFPVVCQMGGPSEIAYFAQMNRLFEVFDVPAPLYRVRPTLTVVERRTEQLMSEMEISFDDLLCDVEQVVNRVLTRTFPTDLEKNFDSLRSAVEERISSFINEALDFDSGLKSTAEQTRGKIDFLLKGFESKVFAAHKKKSQQTRERIYRIANVLYPRRGLQERSLNITYFLSRYGYGVIRYIYDHMNSEETAHQLVSLSEYEA